MLPDKNLRSDWALLLLRVVIGFGFMAHGWAKWSRGPEKFGILLHQIGVPLPGMTAWIVTLRELFGGLAILAGLFVTLISVPLVISMLVAMFTVHLKYGFSSINTIGLTKTGPLFGPPGYEMNLLYIAGLVALAVSNPTPLSLDRWLERRRAQRATPKGGASPTHEGKYKIIVTANRTIALVLFVLAL
jgi:putative oxidoreductase